MTHDMGHVTCDTSWGVNILFKVQLPGFKGLERQCFEDLEEKDDLAPNNLSGTLVGVINMNSDIIIY